MIDSVTFWNWKWFWDMLTNIIANAKSMFQYAFSFIGTPIILKLHN